MEASSPLHRAIRLRACGASATGLCYRRSRTVVQKLLGRPMAARLPHFVTLASYDMTARVWSSSSGSTLLTLTGHWNQLTSVAWSPDGSKIATASHDLTMHVWSSSNGSALLMLTLSSLSSPYSVAWSPDGSKIAIAMQDGTTHVRSSSNGSTLLTLTGQSSYGSAYSVAWSPDGSKIATTYDRSTFTRVEQQQRQHAVDAHWAQMLGWFSCVVTRWKQNRHCIW